MNIELLQSYCKALPFVTEDVKWENDLCFLIGNKMFCVTGLSGDFGVSVKVTDEDFSLMIERDGIEPAPYLARYKWIYISNPYALSEAEWQNIIKQSYALIKAKLPKKVLNGLI